MAIKINNSTIIDDSRNIVNAGVVTATSFVGNVTGNLTGTASTATAAATAFGLSGSPNVTVGVLTATRISAGSTTGTQGQVLQSTGTGVTWATAGGTEPITLSNLVGYNSPGVRNDGANGRLDIFGAGNFQVFTSPGTFIVNPGISSIRVRVVGAGGNGATNVSSPPKGGAGGGGGGYAHKVITSFTAPRSYSVTVGSAPGGTSSFGSEVSATGGSNASGINGGSGGTGSNGDVNYTGATGLGPQPSSGPGRGGSGGAAATQKGNGSGSSVPGLPSLGSPSFTIPGPSTYIVPKDIDYTYYSRFPFDIFNGTPGQIIGDHSPASGLSFNPPARDGYNGGEGHTAFFSQSPSPFVQSGGAGGVGAGGGGGHRNGSTGISQPGGAGGIGGGGGGNGGDTSPGGVGGSGGPGIVIVEW